MDAPRDFLNFYFILFIFSPNEQRAKARWGGGGGGGGGVRCQTFSFSFFPCSADHERDWPPCKVVFFGLATNALNVRNNNNNNNFHRAVLATEDYDVINKNSALSYSMPIPLVVSKRYKATGHVMVAPRYSNQT